ncbi:hypothetical protein [Acinetobacter brisouii]
MKFDFHQKIGARFKLVVRKAKDHSIAHETVWFKNLVLNTGLARMSTGTWIDRCCVGTGNSTPVATQATLDAFLASTSTVQAQSTTKQMTTAPYYYSVTQTWRFGEGVAAGNISEVGLGWGNTNLWNRTLIKDANGNPTTITVLSDEYLDVVAEVRVYPAQTLSGSFNLLNKMGALISTHTFTGLPYIYDPAIRFDQVILGMRNGYLIWDGPIGASVTDMPSGGRYNHESVAISYPTPTSCRAIYTIGLSNAVTSHKSFLLATGGILGGADLNNSGYQLQITPPIRKTAAQKMTYTFELSWGRYTG